MTTVALIAGMIPVAIGAGEGADFRAPLGRAVIGGVITSTLLTLHRDPDGLRDPERVEGGIGATDHQTVIGRWPPAVAYSVDGARAGDARVINATALTIITAAMIVRGVTASPSTAHPRNTATTGFTNA